LRLEQNSKIIEAASCLVISRNREAKQPEGATH